MLNHCAGLSYYPHGSLVCGLWLAGGRRGGSVPTYVLGTFYIGFFLYQGYDIRFSGEAHALYEFIPGPDPSLFFFFVVELYHTSTCCGREFFRAWVKTRNSFPVHHGGRRLWPLPSPMSRRHPNQAHRRHPHPMGDAACAWFGLNPPGGRVVSTPASQRNYVFFLMHARC